MHINLIEQARESIQSYIKRTALEYSQTLSQHLETNVFVKLELFQKTGPLRYAALLTSY
jgi:threonine dehydratase